MVTPKSTSPAITARQGKQQARKVDLRDQVLVGDESVASLGERGGEDLPGQQAHEHKQGIRNIAGEHVEQTAEDQTEQCHHQDGLQDDLRGAERGLLVPHLDIAPDEEVEELEVRPELAEPERHTPLRRADFRQRKLVLAIHRVILPRWAPDAENPLPAAWRIAEAAAAAGCTPPSSETTDPSTLRSRWRAG